jgi:hypothetical protein
MRLLAKVAITLITPIVGVTPVFNSCALPYLLFPRIWIISER